MDINGLSSYTKGPIEVEIKIKGKDDKKSFLNFHCGKTHLWRKEERETGWCATKLDIRGKINLIS